MDALLRVEKNNKKRKSLTGSTISRTSFGSLLESIKETDDRAEEDGSNSDYSKSKAALQIPSKKGTNFKSTMNILETSSEQRSKISQNKSSVQSLTKNKPIHIEKKFAEDIDENSKEKGGFPKPNFNNNFQKTHLNRVLQKLGKSFATENSSKSSNESSYDALKTSYQEKPREKEEIRKKYGTDKKKVRERESDFESSEESFDSDLELDSQHNHKRDQENEVEYYTLEKETIEHFKEKNSGEKMKLQQNFDNSHQFFPKIPTSYLNEINDEGKSSSFEEEKIMIQRQSTSNLIQEKGFEQNNDQKVPYFSNPKTDSNKNQTSLTSSTSEVISSLANKFKQQRLTSSEFLNSDISHYSKASHISTNEKELASRSINSRSKTNHGVTGRRGENPREYTLAIFEYCSHEIGLACYNNSTGEFHLCQLVENLTYFRTLSTVETFSPVEIIYSQNFENTLLIKRLKEKFRQTTFRPIYRRFFDDEAGEALYLKTSSHELLSSNSKFLAMSCFNALIIHLESESENKFNIESLIVHWHRLDQLLIIEPDAIADLEIFYNIETNKSKKCLIENFTCITFGGTRMLRANFLQPPSDSKIILERQKLVEKMLENPALFEYVEKEFYTYKYYEPVTAKFIQSPKEANLKSLKSYLSSIFMLSKQCLNLEKLYQSLEDRNAFELPIIEKLDSKLQSHKLKILKSVIEENFDENILKNFEEVKNKKDKIIFLFKVEKIEDEFALVTRTIYTQTVDTIRQYFNEVRSKSNEEIHLMYNENRGYFFKVNDTVDLHNLTQRLEENLVQISHKGRIVTFSTQILSSLNNRVKETEKILIFQSESLLRKVIEEIQKSIDILFEINQILSTVDMVMSFVRYINRYSMFVKFNKPKFMKGKNRLLIEKLKPVWILTPENFENELEEIDFRQDEENQNILLLEKSSNSISQSIMMYSMAYTVILSQMGCFVPAENVEFNLFESMLSKIQVQEKTDKGLSRFQLNLVKIQSILDNCFIKNEGRSLVLMDEIVKGTQHEEECALSLASIHELQKNNGMSILTTSDRMLIQFLIFYDEFNTIQIFRTKNCELEHQVIEEITQESIETMRKFNFDEQFIENFEEINIKAEYTKNELLEIEKNENFPSTN